MRAASKKFYIDINPCKGTFAYRAFAIKYREKIPIRNRIREKKRIPAIIRKNKPIFSQRFAELDTASL